MDVIIASGVLGDTAKEIDVLHNQRGLVWGDKRFTKVLGAGQYAMWTALMRLKEFEVLEKFATSSNISVVCGDGSISDKILKLI